MAITMEVVGWPSSEVGGSESSYNAPGRTGKKRGWGEDQQKLLQLMMGPSLSKKDDTASSRITLDLLGGSSSSSSQELQSQFLDLNPHDDPLPSGWEKRLDLRSGSIHFVNTFLGICTTVDPRRTTLPTLVPQSGEQLNHEGHGLKVWMEDLAKKNLAEYDLELNLNLSTPTPTTSKKQDSMSVCTLEKVQEALERTQTKGLRQTPAVSEHGPWISQPAASATSSSSSSSSGHLCARRFKSQKLLHRQANDPTLTRASSSAAAAAGIYMKPQENNKGAIVLTGCKRCLTYVMLFASDPVCPRCGATDTNISFPPHKVPEVELKL